MNIKELNIDDIQYYHQNNKEHDDIQVERIANSIKEFWFVQPIVIDSENVIVIGHWRYLAAKRLWMTEVPTLMVDNLDEKQIKKLRILDNKLNESEWDLVNLKLELDDLGDLNFWDLEINIEELFPEFDAPVYNPDEYLEETKWEEDEEKKVAVTVFVANKSDAALLVSDLEWLWYTDVKM